MRLTLLLMCVTLAVSTASAYDKPPSKQSGLITDRFGRVVGQARPGINGQVRYYNRMGTFQGTARPGINRYWMYDRHNRLQGSSPAPVPPQMSWSQMLD